MVKDEMNICMYCGKKSKSKMKYSVLDINEVFRDFCSNKCLVGYYQCHNK